MCPELCESSWQAYERVEDPWTIDEKIAITCGKVILKKKYLEKVFLIYIIEIDINAVKLSSNYRNP